jgi:hypothetical protein
VIEHLLVANGWFKKHNLNIAWLTINTLEQHQTKTKHTRDIYDRCGVYEMKCVDCGGTYVGQTGRKFRVRYRDIKTIKLTRDTRSISGTQDTRMEL